MIEWMNADLKSPDYSCISQRSKAFDISSHRQDKAVRYLVFDATGLIVFDEEQ
jgi:hypothetical protein